MERTVNDLFGIFSKLTHFSFHSCQQLEVQLQSHPEPLSSNNVEIQCSVDKHDEITQTDNETENLESQKDVLKDEINNLNFQLSTFIIQRTTTENVRKEVFINESLYQFY